MRIRLSIHDRQSIPARDARLVDKRGKSWITAAHSVTPFKPSSSPDGLLRTLECKVCPSHSQLITSARYSDNEWRQTLTALPWGTMFPPSVVGDKGSLEARQGQRGVILAKCASRMPPSQPSPANEGRSMKKNGVRPILYSSLTACIVPPINRQ